MIAFQGAGLSDEALPVHTVTTAPGAIVVSADGCRVCLDVAGIPLRESLEQIAAQAGFVLRGRGPLDERVTLRFQDVPVPRALEILLGNRSHMMRFAPAAPGTPRRLVSV